jgi:hypothetical protein
MKMAMDSASEIIAVRPEINWMVCLRSFGTSRRMSAPTSGDSMMTER